MVFSQGVCKWRFCMLRAVTRKHGALLDPLVIAQVVEGDTLGDGAALDTSLTLLKYGRIPGKIEVDQTTKPLEIEPGTRGIRPHQQLQAALRDLFFEHLTIGAMSLTSWCCSRKRRAQ